MLEWISWFAISMLTGFVDLLIYQKFLEQKEKCSNLKIVITLIVFSIFNAIIVLNVGTLLKMMLNLILTILMYKIIFNEKITKVTLMTLVCFIVYTISELLSTSILITLIGIDSEIFKFNFLGVILINCIIMGISYMFFFIKYVKNFTKNILEWYETKDVINNIFLTFVSFITAFFFIYQNYMGKVTKTDLIMTVIFFGGIIYIVFTLFKEKTNNIKMSTEYDQLLKYVKTYEDVIEKKGKEQHEYTNQLILIRSMIEENDSKVLEIIDKNLKTNKNEKDTKWLEKLKNIPNGGLKGLLHYKISDMLKNKIKVYVDIEDSVNSKKIKEKCNKELEDISKIIGVYLDNAIEASKEAQNKYIVIEAKNVDNVLSMTISNTYKDEVELGSMDKSGYSTKNRGTGYGLAIVREIVKKHRDIETYREMNGMYFVQHLNIKID